MNISISYCVTPNSKVRGVFTSILGQLLLQLYGLSVARLIVHIPKLTVLIKQTLTNLKVTNKIIRVCFVLHLEASLKIMKILVKISNVSVKLQNRL